MERIRTDIPHILAAGAFVCSVFALLGSIASGHINPHLFFTSDELALIVQLEDWLAGTPLSSINVAVGVYLPDYIAVFLLHKIVSGNPALVVYGFVVLLILFSTFGWILLAGEVFGHGKAVRSVTFSVCASAFLCVSYYPDPFRVVVHPAYHTTAFAILPFALCLLLRAVYSQRRSVWKLTALFLLPVVVSDRIFIPWFVIPAFAAALLNKNCGRAAYRAKPLLALACGSAVLFAIVKFYFQISGFKLVYVSPEQTFFDFVHASFYNFFVWWLPRITSIYTGFAVLWLVWAAWMAHLVRREADAKTRFVLIFLLAAAIFPVVSLIASGLYGFVIGVPEHHGVVRYFIPAIFIPLFFGWIFPMGVLRGGRLKTAFSAALSVCVIFLSVPRISGLENARSLAGYYPETVRCFDEAAEKHNLESGLSSFWFSGYLRALSKRKPQISPVMRFLERNPDGTRKHLFDNVHQNWEIARGTFDFFFANKETHPPMQDSCGGDIRSPRCQNYPRPKDSLWTQTLDAPEFAKLVGETPTAKLRCGINEIYVFKNPPLRLLPPKP